MPGVSYNNSNWIIIKISSNLIFTDANQFYI